MMTPPAGRFARPGRIAQALLCTSAMLALAACPPGQHRHSPHPANHASADSLTDPLTVRSVNGVLSATLEVDTVHLPVTRAGAVTSSGVIKDTITTDTLPLRAYRLTATTDPAAHRDPRFGTAHFPGPTFRVRPGDLVQIRLVNNLPESSGNDVCMSYPATTDAIPPSDHFQDCFHGPNFTNIHYHGMHVTPDSTSTVVGDDVLMVIPPGGTILYSFRIPMNQSPGTHWYHPHKHGSVAIQVANGMAGAFIVEDPETGLDWFTREHGIRDHVIAFQQVDTTVGLLHGNTINILDKIPPLVNGQNFPTIYMVQDEIQRWRFVNENVTRNSKSLQFAFEDRPGEEPVMVEVARDGVQFAAANLGVDTDTTLLLGAGNRLDVFVRAPHTPGEHLFRVGHNGGTSRRTRAPVLPVRRHARDDPDREQLADTNSYLLFRVVVLPRHRNGNHHIGSSITNFARYLEENVPGPPVFLRTDLAAAHDSAVIVFSDTGGPGDAKKPTQFFLGSATDPHQKFNDDVVFTPSNAEGTSMPMVLDSTQTWRVVNASRNQINHPFHIHINPFQVDSVHVPMGALDPFHALYVELNAAARRGSPIWLDVLPLPQPAFDTTFGSDGKILKIVMDTAYAFITQRYDRLDECSDEDCGSAAGRFVMHCHILGHEERGMMQVLEVFETAGDAESRPHVHRGTHGAGGAEPATGTGAALPAVERGRPPPPGEHRH